MRQSATGIRGPQSPTTSARHDELVKIAMFVFDLLPEDAQLRALERAERLRADEQARKESES